MLNADSLLKHLRDRLSADEIFEALSFPDNMKVIPIYQDLRRPRTGIIVGRHGKTVGPGAHDRQKVSLLGSRNFPILGKKITALADRSHYIGYDHLPLSFDDRTDRLIRTVERSEEH